METKRQKIDKPIHCEFDCKKTYGKLFFLFLFLLIYTVSI